MIFTLLGAYFSLNVCLKEMVGPKSVEADTTLMDGLGPKKKRAQLWERELDQSGVY